MTKDDPTDLRRAYPPIHRPPMTRGRWLVATPLAEEVGAIRRLRKRAIRRGRAGDVHDLRASLRRLALVATLGRTSPSLPLGLDSRAFPTAMRALGKTRDCDVLIDRLAEVALTAKGADLAAAKKGIRRLRRRRRRRHDRARRVLDSPRFRRALRAWRRAVRHDIWSGSPNGGLPTTWLRSAFDQIRTQPGWALPAFDSDGYDRTRERARHALRGRLRELRDLARLFASEGSRWRTLGTQAGVAAHLLGELRDWTQLRHDLEPASSRLAAGALARLRVLGAEWEQHRLEWIAFFHSGFPPPSRITGELG